MRVIKTIFLYVFNMTIIFGENVMTYYKERCEITATFSSSSVYVCS